MQQIKVVLEGFGSEVGDVTKLAEETITRYEGSVYLRTRTGAYKRHYMVIMGNELYFYRHRNDNEHKIYHCLTGTYIKDSSLSKSS